MKCEICGIDDTQRVVRKIKGKYLCSKHITQLYRNGGFLDKTIYDANDYVLYDDYAEIILRDKRSQENGRAIIDLDKVDICKRNKWHLRHGKNTDYVIASGPNNQKTHLHRFVLNYEGKDDVDHINHNGLDNRICNLRIVPHSINLRNQHNDRKGIKLVGSGRYQAIITVDGKGIYLGTFNTYAEAYDARLSAERQFDGR